MGKTAKPKANKQKVVTSLANIPLPDAVPSPQEEDTVDAQEEAESDEKDEEVQQAEAEVVEDRVPPQFRGATPGGRRMTREEAMAFFQQCGMGVFIPAAQQPPVQIQYVSPVQPTAQPSAQYTPVDFNTFFRNMGNNTMGNKSATTTPFFPNNFFGTTSTKKKMTKKEEEEFFKDEFFWNPGPEWDTIGLIAGGVACAGIGAILYHLLKK